MSVLEVRVRLTTGRVAETKPNFLSAEEHWLRLKLPCNRNATVITGKFAESAASVKSPESEPESSLTTKTLSL